GPTAPTAILEPFSRYPRTPLPPRPAPPARPATSGLFPVAARRYKGATPAGRSVPGPAAEPPAPRREEESDPTMRTLGVTLPPVPSPPAPRAQAPTAPPVVPTAPAAPPGGAPAAAPGQPPGAGQPPAAQPPAPVAGRLDAHLAAWETTMRGLVNFRADFS